MYKQVKFPQGYSNEVLQEKISFYLKCADDAINRGNEVLCDKALRLVMVMEAELTNRGGV